MTEPNSRCFLDTCRDVAHVVLYAAGDRLGGQNTRERQPVAFCLKHGGQVYDVIREWNGRVASASRLARVPRQAIWDPAHENPVMRHSATCPNWLVADLRNARLPRTSPDPKGWPVASPMALNRGRTKGR